MTSDGQGLCPGENACDIFQSAKGESRLEKELNSCKAGCPMYASKINPDAMLQESKVKGVLNRALFYRQKRRSGFWTEGDKAPITSCESQVLMMLDEQYEAFSRVSSYEQAELLKEFLKVIASR